MVEGPPRPARPGRRRRRGRSARSPTDSASWTGSWPWRTSPASSRCVPGQTSCSGRRAAAAGVATVSRILGSSRSHFREHPFRSCTCKALDCGDHPHNN